MARGLVAAGHDVTLFTTGDSTCPVPMNWALEHAEGMRIGMAVPELRHVIHAYEVGWPTTTSSTTTPSWARSMPSASPASRW